jgi:hypothetical protein
MLFLSDGNEIYDRFNRYIMGLIEEIFESVVKRIIKGI